MLKINSNDGSKLNSNVFPKYINNTSIFKYEDNNHSFFKISWISLCLFKILLLLTKIEFNRKKRTECKQMYVYEIKTNLRQPTKKAHETQHKAHYTFSLVVKECRVIDQSRRKKIDIEFHVKHQNQTISKDYWRKNILVYFIYIFYWLID